ncbi:MAG: hypothetical protein WAV00_24565 [Nocardioides sp.]
MPSPGVDRVLDSLRAPASRKELAREDHAPAEFHRARLVPPPTRSNARSPRAARTGLKAALASAAAVALCSTGAAFAATGHAPWSKAPGSASAASTADHSLPTHPTHPAHSLPTDDPSESAGGSPDVHVMWGLCRAHQSGAKDAHGAALQSPAFVALAQAAGGADQVVTFGATLPRPGGDNAAPSHPAHPTHPVKPTQAATPTHPTHPAKPSHPAPTHPTPSHPSSTSHPVPPSHPAAPHSHSTARSHPLS